MLTRPAPREEEDEAECYEAEAENFRLELKHIGLEDLTSLQENT